MSCKTGKDVLMNHMGCILFELGLSFFLSDDLFGIYNDPENFDLGSDKARYAGFPTRLSHLR
eukprot:5750940-Pleurochrysis_carterae.AAC.3